MFSNIKAFLGGLAKGVLGRMFELIPGGWITVICLLFDGYALHGAGLLSLGAISGIALCFSVLFIILASNKVWRENICRFIAYHGSKIDIALTLLLTWYGFQAGPTMGMIALFLGLNISMFCAIIRWAYFLTRPEEKAAYEGKNKAKSTSSDEDNGFGAESDKPKYKSRVRYGDSVRSGA